MRSCHRPPSPCPGCPRQSCQQARQKNAGWRIDYFVASQRLLPSILDAKIHTDILGSDHCPVELTLK